MLDQRRAVSPRRGRNCRRYDALCGVPTPHDLNHKLSEVRILLQVHDASPSPDMRWSRPATICASEDELISEHNKG